MFLLHELLLPRGRVRRGGCERRAFPPLIMIVFVLIILTWKTKTQP
jgi:hypothetical protein